MKKFFQKDDISNRIFYENFNEALYLESDAPTHDLSYSN